MPYMVQKIYHLKIYTTNKFTENTDNDGINLVIFDADNNFTERKKEIEKKKEEFDIQFELFLFPNNQDSGDFEILLESISNKEHKCIFECFDKYQNCLSSKNTTYILPNRKARIFAFLETLGEETQPKKRNYCVEKCWDLNSAILNSLKIFLTEKFQK